LPGEEKGPVFLARDFALGKFLLTDWQRPDLNSSRRDGHDGTGRKFSAGRRNDLREDCGHLVAFQSFSPSIRIRTTDGEVAREAVSV